MDLDQITPPQRQSTTYASFSVNQTWTIHATIPLYSPPFSQRMNHRHGFSSPSKDCFIAQIPHKTQIHLGGISVDDSNFSVQLARRYLIQEPQLTIQ